MNVALARCDRGMPYELHYSKRVRSCLPEPVLLVIPLKQVAGLAGDSSPTLWVEKCCLFNDVSRESRDTRFVVSGRPSCQPKEDGSQEGKRREA